MSIIQGDIVLAPFRFSETEEAKFRPALVWEVTPISATMIFISSQKMVKAFEKEVILHQEDALAIGLTKPSRIDFGKRDRILISDVSKKLGNLQNLRRAKLKECFQAAIAASLI